MGLIKAEHLETSCIFQYNAIENQIEMTQICRKIETFHFNLKKKNSI